jgi:hypothetical protein
LFWLDFKRFAFHWFNRIEHVKLSHILAYSIRPKYIVHASVQKQCVTLPGGAIQSLRLLKGKPLLSSTIVKFLRRS